MRLFDPTSIAFGVAGLALTWAAWKWKSSQSPQKDPGTQSLNSEQIDDDRTVANATLGSSQQSVKQPDRPSQNSVLLHQDALSEMNEWQNKKHEMKSVFELGDVLDGIPVFYREERDRRFFTWDVAREKKEIADFIETRDKNMNKKKSEGLRKYVSYLKNSIVDVKEKHAELKSLMKKVYNVVVANCVREANVHSFLSVQVPQCILNNDFLAVPSSNDHEIRKLSKYVDCLEEFKISKAKRLQSEKLEAEIRAQELQRFLSLEEHWNEIFAGMVWQARLRYDKEHHVFPDDYLDQRMATFVKAMASSGNSQKMNRNQQQLYDAECGCINEYVQSSKKKPIRGSYNWLKAIVEEGGFLEYFKSIKSSYEGKIDIEKEYNIFEVGRMSTACVVHVHWKTIGDKAYIAASSIKWRADPHGEKSGSVSRPDLQDLKLPTEPHETFGAPPY